MVDGAALGTRHTERPLFLFEPQPACRPALARARVPNQVVVPAAVSDEEGSATIFADTPGSCVASVHRRRDSYFGDMTAHQEKVPVITARALPRGEQLSRVSGDAGVPHAAQARRQETDGVRRRVSSGRVRGKSAAHHVTGAEE
ncbi:hypothetical protein [Streptomyces sp. WMMC940]|uniref:hypothetical protein n=1 Tax=Streptomyces sp. WMMC940 TaxID=3015153 RepID=UPI0022B73148|nr:hypothetical protein [Streptomyces sp. WMMC940]MCZ7457120.1 hypothetical protein [Streptomyces sp. WMMC940]